jgi:hypothetical protein
VTVLEEGGHVAEILDKRTGINPLWIPPWPSLEPSAFGAAVHAQYGAGADAKLLAGIMGHNLCLDLFGGPSKEEEAAGVTAHGEGSVAHYTIEACGSGLQMRAHFPLAQIAFERRIELYGWDVRIRESVENEAAWDRPMGWTQHVTLGPPFLEAGVTQFRVSAAQSLSFEGDFGVSDYLRPGAKFAWPHAPRRDGGTADLRVMNGAAASSAFTAHLLNGAGEDAFFAAFAPSERLLFGYTWKTADFPWMGIWEENHSRTHAPWNGRTLTRGMEFGVSPFPESRRAMVERGRLFDVPAYRWLPAKSRLEVEYWATIQERESIPESLVPPDIRT